MIIGVLGSGPVGITLAKSFVTEGHEVYVATREPDSEKGKELKDHVEGAKVVDFVTAAKSAEIVVLCVKVDGLEEVIKMIGADNLANKIVIDTTNALKPEEGILVYAGGEKSEAEKVQELLPESKVVKAFNTVGAAMMYKPDFGDQIPTMFIAGDDKSAKQTVAEIVTNFGWEPLDCGGLITSRSIEPMAPIWVNNSIVTGSPHHAFKML